MLGSFYGEENTFCEGRRSLENLVFEMTNFRCGKLDIEPLELSLNLLYEGIGKLQGVRSQGHSNRLLDRDSCVGAGDMGFAPTKLFIFLFDLRSQINHGKKKNQVCRIYFDLGKA